MKAKNLFILIVVLAILAGAAYLTSRSRYRAVAPSPLVGTAVFTNLPINDVSRIVFQSAASTVTVAKVDGVWAMPAKYGYPASFDRVRRFLRTLADLKIGEVVESGAEQAARLDLRSPVQGGEKTGTLVSLLKASGEEIASTVLGKTHMRKRAGAAMAEEPGGFADGRFIAVGGKIYLVAEPFNSVPSDPMDWLSRDLVNVYSADIVELSVTGPGREAVRLSRPQDAEELQLDGLGADEETVTAKAASMSSAYGYLRFVDVADPALAAETLGLAKSAAVVCTARTKQGKVFTLNIGKEKEEKNGDRYVSLAVALLPVESSPSGAEGAKETETSAPQAVTNQPATTGEAAKADTKPDPKVEERKKLEADVAAANSQLSKWIYLISKQDAESFLTERKDLAKKKEPAPATGSASDSGGEPAAPGAGGAGFGEEMPQ